ncbi:MAG: outer membrane lipoprotein chaperone LolA [Gammaproteobacteria bacterium]|nr:outer membrane lipoprotein chaperone LolA [Gammaproteobacteria bacterium]
MVGVRGAKERRQAWLLAEGVSERKPEGQQMRSNCRRARQGALVSVALALGLAGALHATEADDAARLEALLAPLATFEADFEQVVTDADGIALETSTGRMTLNRPGRLRWEVREPWPQLVLADGISLWVHEPDLEQVTVRPLAGALAGTPAMLLLEAPGSLVTHFAVVGEGGGSFRLLPQDERSLYRALHLAFEGDEAGAMVPRSLEIVDHMDRTTQVRFTNATTAPVPTPALFEFDVPPGTDVIGEVGVPEPTAHSPEVP